MKNQDQAVTHLLNTATAALRLKQEMVSKEMMRAVAKYVHLKQYEGAEVDLTAVIEKQINAQVESIAKELAKLDVKAKTQPSDNATALISQSFNPRQWKEAMVDAMLPVMAIKMAEAAVASMIQLGVNPRSKGVRLVLEKHLGGQHNQMSHGRLGGTVRGKDGKLTMTDGSPLPAHVPKNIPPAWTDVEVALDPKSDLLVKGKDAKGRVQSVYSEEHWTKAALAKFSRTNELIKKQKAIRSELEKDIKGPNREEASCLRLIQETGIRPGGTGNTLVEKQAYGATTLEGRHVRVSTTGNVTLRFTGKKGVDLAIPVTDPATKKDLIARKKKAGAKGKLFGTNAGKLSQYSHSKDGGGFKTKDFRTAKGTQAAIEAVKRMKAPATQAMYKKAVKEVAKKVSTQLGNTPTVALNSYIDPVVFSGWRVK